LLKNTLARLTYNIHHTGKYSSPAGQRNHDNDPLPSNGLLAPAAVPLAVLVRAVADGEGAAADAAARAAQPRLTGFGGLFHLF
jgi:hypothetical protein